MFLMQIVHFHFSAIHDRKSYFSQNAKDIRTIMSSLSFLHVDFISRLCIQIYNPGI